MLKAKLERNDGTDVYLIGLSKENVKRLQKDQPIRFNMSDFDPSSKAEVLIVYGETEQAIKEAIEAVVPYAPKEGEGS